MADQSVRKERQGHSRKDAASDEMCRRQEVQPFVAKTTIVVNDGTHQHANGEGHEEQVDYDTAYGPNAFISSRVFATGLIDRLVLCHRHSADWPNGSPARRRPCQGDQRRALVSYSKATAVCTTPKASRLSGQAKLAKPIAPFQGNMFA